MQQIAQPVAMCNHTSVGLMVIDEAQGGLLMLARQKFPYGVACPAGHVENGETYEAAAVRELREETGLTVVDLTQVFDVVVENQCRRPYGDWHRWKVYMATVTGELVENEDEARWLDWCAFEELAELAQRTERYLRGQVSEASWQQQPGLEPVWYRFLKQVQILR